MEVGRTVRLFYLPATVWGHFCYLLKTCYQLATMQSEKTGQKVFYSALFSVITEEKAEAETYGLNTYHHCSIHPFSGYSVSFLGS